MTLPIDVEGPVRAEVFVVARDGGQVLLTGPCGAAPWHIETQSSGHPLELVRAMANRVLGEPMLVHSTSWRWDLESVVLSFVVVIDAARVGDMPSAVVTRSELARGEATAAPESIDGAQVLEHALRHLAWLAAEDDVVASTLDEGWHEALSRYVPEPFQQLEGAG